MRDSVTPAEKAPRQPWYKFGVAILIFEMVIAVAVSFYSLYLTFHGSGGLAGKH